jgi:hypothetical protein
MERNNTETQNTENRKQNLQNEETNIKRIIKKHKTHNQNIKESKRDTANNNRTTYYTVTLIQT